MRGNLTSQRKHRNRLLQPLHLLQPRPPALLPIPSKLDSLLRRDPIPLKHLIGRRPGQPRLDVLLGPRNLAFDGEERTAVGEGLTVLEQRGDARFEGLGGSLFGGNGSDVALRDDGDPMGDAILGAGFEVDEGRVEFDPDELADAVEGSVAQIDVAILVDVGSRVGGRGVLLGLLGLLLDEFTTATSLVGDESRVEVLVVVAVVAELGLLGRSTAAMSSSSSYATTRDARLALDGRRAVRLEPESGVDFGLSLLGAVLALAGDVVVGAVRKEPDEVRSELVDRPELDGSRGACARRLAMGLGEVSLRNEPKR